MSDQPNYRPSIEGPVMVALILCIGVGALLLAGLIARSDPSRSEPCPCECHRLPPIPHLPTGTLPESS